jgi:hypothetical protein
MIPKIEVQLALEATNFAAGTKQAQSSLNNFVAGIGSRIAGVLSVGAFYRIAREALDLGDRVGDMAKKLGVSTDQIQEFEYAARKTGASVEAFQTALRTLISTQQDALSKGAASDAFKPYAMLGISFAELKRLSPDQLLYRVGDAFRDSSQEGQQLDAVISLLGRGAMDLMGALKEGLRTLGEEAQSTGQVLGEEMIQGLGAANDQLEILQQRAKLTTAGILGTLWNYGAAGLGATLGAFAHAALGGFSKAAFAEAKFAAPIAFRSLLGLPTFVDLNRKKTTPTVSDMWSRIGDPGSIKDWTSHTIGAGERNAPPSFGSADALARIGLFRGGYDPGERTRLMMLTELRTLNRSAAQTNRLLTDE